MTENTQTGKGKKTALGDAIQNALNASLDTKKDEAQKAVSSEVVVKDSNAEVVHYHITPGACVKALEKASGFGKQALYLELAVSLAVFSGSSTGADKPTKRSLTDIYTQAGYDTRQDGEHYKTVNRRINASAALFETIGKDAIDSAMQGLRDGKAIDALGQYLLNNYKFSGINAVLEFAGKPVQQTNTPDKIAARKEANNALAAVIGEKVAESRKETWRDMAAKNEVDDDATIVSSGVLSVVVPRSAKAEDVRAMAVKLMQFADRLDLEDREANATPEELRNQEMHS